MTATCAVTWILWFCMVHCSEAWGGGGGMMTTTTTSSFCWRTTHHRRRQLLSAAKKKKKKKPLSSSSLSFWSTTTATRTTPTRLYASSSSSEDGDDADDALRRRMEMVRSLQVAFYKSDTDSGGGGSNSTAAQRRGSGRLDVATGRILDLPLWRVQWSEVPGRTNVLNVHEPMYTNMFERILRSDPPWYAGHLYLPGGSKSLRSDKDALRLKTWREEAEAGEAADEEDEGEKSAVLGTVLQIADYRRLADGRLLLLVQATERFAVDRVVQELPYGVADVRLVPDGEEVLLSAAAAAGCNGDGNRSSRDDDDRDWLSLLASSENEIQRHRAAAVAESVLKWHRYEYEQTVLPLPLKSELPAAEVLLGADLSQVLPYAAFSSVINVQRLAAERVEDALKAAAAEEAAEEGGSDANAQATGNRSSSNSNSSTASCCGDDEVALERQWIQAGVLQNCSQIVDRHLLDLSAGELERRIWLSVDGFLKRTKTPVSPVLLGLVPPPAAGQQREWPDHFVLDKIADAIEQRGSAAAAAANLGAGAGAGAGEQQQRQPNNNKYVRRVSEHYPAARRQKRLSYAAASLLESNADTVTAVRQQLLSLPTTRSRLAWVLQRMEEEWTAFQ